MPDSPESRRALDTIRAFAQEQGIELEEGSRPGEVVLTIPGEHKLKTTCSLMAGGSMLSVSAFVIRNPDENHRAVYRYLLQRNLSMPGMAYAIDEHGDVYLTGQIPLSAVDEDRIDSLLGVVLTGSDDVFNELLVLGFLTSMRKEWSWRVSREESLANLESFRDILAKEEQDSDRANSHETHADAPDAASPLTDGPAADDGTDEGRTPEN